ncbi:MAG: maleylacetate reductase [Rhodococcus sp. (in: high G+C Gram-positive bacteria)]
MVWRFQANPSRVVFGWGAVEAIVEELDYIGVERVLVLSTPHQRELAETIAADLGDRAAGVHAGARMHVPVSIVDDALAAVRTTGADGCLAVGGGSTIGLGKSVARRSSLPVIAVPTTYSGSEMTPLWGETEAGVKTTGTDMKVLPSAVVYDPQLTTGLPLDLTVTSSINAVAHAVEALYSSNGSPLISLMAEESIRSIATALPIVHAERESKVGRADLLRGSWMAGTCLGSVSMGLHHKLCHTLGGALDLPHSDTHTVLLPHVMALNLSAHSAAYDAVCRALGVGDDPAGALWDLVNAVEGPTSLRELGVDEDDLLDIAATAVSAPYPNPVPLTLDNVMAVLSGAVRGVRPTSTK